MRRGGPLQENIGPFGFLNRKFIGTMGRRKCNQWNRPALAAVCLWFVVAPSAPGARPAAPERLFYELTQTAPAPTDLERWRNQGALAAHAGQRFWLVQSFACDTGGYEASMRVAGLRRTALERALAPAARAARADLVFAATAVLPGEPRRDRRRSELRFFDSRAALNQALREANAYAAEQDALAQEQARTRDDAGSRETAAPAATGKIQHGWGWALLILALLAAALYFAKQYYDDSRRRRHQLSAAEGEALATLTGGAVTPLPPANDSPSRPRSAAASGDNERSNRAGGTPIKDFLTSSRSVTEMSVRKKKTQKGQKITPISIRGAVDRNYEDRTLSQLAKSPVDALEGLTPRHARLLEEAFGVKTLEDLARLRYVEIARAICVLAQYEE